MARGKFHASVLQLALEANLDESSFDLVGDPLDDRFEIRFTGNRDRATSQAAQFYSSLQLGRGKWKKQVVLNDADQEIRFFVAPDKNPSQIKREILSKNLKDIVAKKISKEVWVNKQMGTLYVDRRKLCVVHIVSEESYRLDWTHTKLHDLGLDEATLSEEFKTFQLGREGSRS